MREWLYDAILIFLLASIIFIVGLLGYMAYFLATVDPCDVNRDGRVTLTDMEIVKERLLEDAR
ncbi:MAG TPA: dockerin type I domain-containing protein [Candidatus Hydrogenedentes bacterium]|nr:dockerin type I domain-containing protein [Candidatus Hydrogenedentota bacterium]